MKILFLDEEIKSWLSKNEVENFAILDDNEEASIDGHTFLTYYLHGLTADIADQVINFLGESSGR